MCINHSTAPEMSSPTARLDFLAKTSIDGRMDDRSFPTLIAIYLDACRAEGKSPRTVVAYGETLRQYLELARQYDLPLRVDAVTPTDVYRFIAAVRARNVSDATQHRRHRELKHFFSWLKRMEVVSENPFQKVPLIRLEQKIVQPLTIDDLGRLLAALDPATPLGTRDRALTLFLLDTGVRASEAVNFDFTDIDFANGRARVLHGKGRKQRVIAFGPAVTDALLRYLDHRGEQDGPLFLTRQGLRMRATGLIVLYQRLGALAGVNHVHPHRFRHTFATMAIRAAAREIDVQHLLGHSTSAMVRRYTRTYDSENAALAHATFSPVAQLRRHEYGTASPDFSKAFQPAYSLKFPCSF